MATLQGGPLGPLPDPGALSPAQVEQLRNLKVGASPTSASTKVQLPRDKDPDWGEETREKGAVACPQVGTRKALGDPRLILGLPGLRTEPDRRLKVQEGPKLGVWPAKQTEITADTSA